VLSKRVAPGSATDRPAAKYAKPVGGRTETPMELGQVFAPIDDFQGYQVMCWDLSQDVLEQ